MNIKQLSIVGALFAFALFCGLSSMMIADVGTVEAPATSPPIFQSDEDTLIARQFTLWGTHTKLIEYVKEGMHNPNSFQHVDTLYIKNNTYISVTMTYRGTNAFGGIVTETITRRFTYEGEMLDEQ